MSATDLPAAEVPRVVAEATDGVEWIADPTDPRLADYVALTDVALRRRTEPERGLYVAESEKVIRRALAAGHRPRSFLMAERWLTDLADVVADAREGGIPIYVGEHDVICLLYTSNVYKRQAYERRALGIASHWSFEDWGRFLPEHTTAVSLLDRLLHHATTVVTSCLLYTARCV